MILMFNGCDRIVDEAHAAPPTRSLAHPPPAHRHCKHARATEASASKFAGSPSTPFPPRHQHPPTTSPSARLDSTYAPRRQRRARSAATSSPPSARAPLPARAYLPRRLTDDDGARPSCAVYVAPQQNASQPHAAPCLRGYAHLRCDELVFGVWITGALPA